MANLINCENISKSFGFKTLLDSISPDVQEDDHTGAVGLNDDGKSTLPRILTGVEPVDSGHISRANDMAMTHITQDTELDPNSTVLECVITPLGLARHKWTGNVPIREVLDSIGINNLGMDTKVVNLSDGERRYVSLATALVRDLDLLILDGPTNHLGIRGVQWLADHVFSRRAVPIVVTHNHWFLDTVATKTWEVHDSTVDFYDGGYNDWTFVRAERACQADAAEQRRQNLARKELAWLCRGALARTSRPRCRIEAAEVLIADAPALRNSMGPMAFPQHRQGRVVVELEHACPEMPDGRELLNNVIWRLVPGKYIDLVGVSGSGKTTLLCALAGGYPLSEGKRIEGKTVRLGWLCQEFDDLLLDMRVLDTMENVVTYAGLGKKQIGALQLIERLGSSPKRRRTPIADLSGGKRRRLQLTYALTNEPNFLLLDESTNGLDIDTLQELGDLLDNWLGTLVVISRDHYLIEHITDSTWALFGDGELTDLPGGIGRYLQHRVQPADSAASGGASQVSTSSPQVRGAASEEGASKLLVAETHAVQKKMSAPEWKMVKLSQKEGELHAQMAEASTDVVNLDTQRLVDLDRRAAEVAKQKAELEMEWLELGEQLED